jgi:DNA ligase (NAD+)
MSPKTQQKSSLKKGTVKKVLKKTLKKRIILIDDDDDSKSKSKSKTSTKQLTLVPVKHKRSRCPNGTRKNKKTGNCEPMKIKQKQINKIDFQKVVTKQVKSKSPMLTKMEIQQDTKAKIKSYNADFIKLMDQLYKIMMSQGAPFRARAYKKAQETIMTIQEPITNVDMLKGKPGIGETIISKLNEFVETGTLKLIEREKNNPVNIFTEVYGIGPKKAKELVVKDGIKTISELRTREDLLNDKQKIGLKYYEAILERIPRPEIAEFEKTFEGIFKSLGSYEDGASTFEIVGSYRRGAKDSGDIDVIISNKKDNKAIFKDFIDALIKKNVIIEVLSRGPTKSLVIGRLNEESTARRIDFLYATPTEYPFAVLYFTGSALFNTVMRQRALDMGYSMNEHGMYRMVGKKKGALIDTTFESEQDIFDFLQMEYKEPQERIDGNSVVIITEPQEKPKPKPTQVKKLKKKTKLTVVNDDEVLESTQLKTKPKSKSSIKTTKKHINEFGSIGVSYLKELKKTQLEKMIRESNKAYYNSEPLLSDNQYDILKEYIERVYPKSKALKEIGAPLEIEKEKVKLPYFMGSMDKIKPDTGALEKWMNKYKGTYTLSAKLDGISGLYVCENGTQKLYTRGDGTYGQDITYLIPYLKLPSCASDQSVVIRGELIMSKEVFEEKYKDTASNARNLVAGIINSKKSASKEKFNDVDFVAYELIKPVLGAHDQFTMMSEGSKEETKLTPLDVVIHKYISDAELSNDMLSELLVSWRDSYKYEIDGVIVAHDGIHPRKEGNPDHAFAFKMMLTDQIAEAKVLDVIWSPSKHGYLKPRIQIEPVIIGGAKIEYATAFNGAFVEENKIGVGALIRLVRSGDVIPHILSVVQPAPKAKMPDVEYKWTDTHVDIMLVDTSSDDIVKEKNITAFFTGLGVAGLSSGNVKRIMKAGFDSIEKILSMTISDFLTVEGFKIKMATKVHDSIHTMIDTLTIVKILAVANIFGRGMGERRLKVIFKAYPDILINTSMSDAEKIASVASLEGFALKTSRAFVENINNAVHFLNRTNLMDKYKDFINKENIKIHGAKDDIKTTKTHELYGKKVLLTGFRSKELEKAIEEVGGEIASAVSKKVAFVIVRDLDESTGKADKARKLEIPLILEDDFKKQFDL